MSVTVTRLLRYPVKGFGAQALSEAVLIEGRGLPGDRRFAVTNGQAPVASDGRWTPAQGFVRMTRNPNLPLFGIDLIGTTLSLRHPDGRAAVGDPTRPDGLERLEEALASWFSTTARLVEAEGGYWDHRDAAISLINPASVAALATQSGRSLDIARFRGNVLLGGLPAWTELAWIGRRLRIGEAEIEILRPIDRCKATSIDPATGLADANVPALLSRHVGHAFCGVYARVVRRGRVAPGGTIADIGPALAALGSAAIETAPLPADWPRVGRIVTAVRETDEVVSLTIADPLAAAGLGPRLRPGQHIRLHHPGELGWRCYTVSGTTGGWRITVRRQQGFSAWLHDLGVGDSVTLSGPFGDFVLPDVARRPIVLISAGIGITPMVAMARDLAGRSVRMIHVARHGGDLALWPELRKTGHGADLKLHLTQPRPGDLVHRQAVAGRPDWTALAAEIRDAEVYLCGPRDFLRQAIAAFVATGLPETRLHVENFVSPDRGAGAPIAPPGQGPYRVRFTRSGVDAVWTPEAGSLLDLAEAAGLALKSHCRSGTCGSCRQAITAGTIKQMQAPALPVPTGTALLCSTVPVSDLVVAA
ncbi:MAG: MOSC domain-containing protein [Alphaproteobacteria bacterium]|jgi:ferredoxin-NADP reductase/uncharacterized protein YcbX|nr:MOSC domain-containing protein [Alphaproteobacteria bacterium]